MNRLGVQAIPCHSVGTIIHMAIDGKYAGHIVISDIVKLHSKEAIQALKSAGVRKTVMLTGDAKKVADSVASALEFGMRFTVNCFLLTRWRRWSS